MKKGIKALSLILALLVVFMLGWRVMPKVWPMLKQNIVYPVFPQLKPEVTPVTTPEPYHPKSDSVFGETITTSDSMIYYFYKDYCPYCRELEPLTAGLPKQITLADGTTSNVKLICLNKVEEDIFKIITDYYETHEVPAERQYVPALVIGDRYLFLKTEIVGQLMEALVAGEGLKTPMLDGSQRVQE